MEGISHSTITKFYSSQHVGSKKEPRLIKKVDHKVGIRYTAMYKSLLNLCMCLGRNECQKDIISVIIRSGLSVLLTLLIQDANIHDPKSRSLLPPLKQRNGWSVYKKEGDEEEDSVSSLRVLARPCAIVECPDAKPEDTILDIPSYVNGVVVVYREKRLFIPDSFFEMEVLRIYNEKKNTRQMTRYIRNRKNTLILLTVGVFLHVLLVLVVFSWGEFREVLLNALYTFFMPLFYLTNGRYTWRVINSAVS